MAAAVNAAVRDVATSAPPKKAKKGGERAAAPKAGPKNRQLIFISDPPGGLGASGNGLMRGDTLTADVGKRRGRPGGVVDWRKAVGAGATTIWEERRGTTQQTKKTRVV